MSDKNAVEEHFDEIQKYIGWVGDEHGHIDITSSRTLEVSRDLMGIMQGLHPDADLDTIKAVRDKATDMCELVGSLREVAESQHSNTQWLVGLLNGYIQRRLNDG